MEITTTDYNHFMAEHHSEIELLKKLSHKTDQEYNKLLKLSREIQHVIRLTKNILYSMNKLEHELKRMQKARSYKAKKWVSNFEKAVFDLKKYEPILVTDETEVFNLTKYLNLVIDKAETFAEKEVKDIKEILSNY